MLPVMKGVGKHVCNGRYILFWYWSQMIFTVAQSHLAQGGYLPVAASARWYPLLVFEDPNSQAEFFAVREPCAGTASG